MERWKIAGVVATLGMSSDVSDGLAIAFVIAMVVKAFGLGPVEVGLLLGAAGWGGIIGTLFSGPLVDYFGRKRLWCLQNFVVGVLWLLSALSPDWVTLYGFRLAIGLITAFGTATTYPLLAEIVPKEVRGKFLATFSGLGALVGLTIINSIPILTAWYPWLPWYFICYLMGGWNIIVSILGAIFIYESPVWKKRADLIEKGEIKESKVPLKTFVQKQYFTRYVITVVAAVGASLLSLPMMLRTYYGTSVLGISIAIAGLVGWSEGPVDLILRYFWGRYSDRAGRLTAIPLAVIICVVSSLLMLYAHYFIPVGSPLMIVLFFITADLIGFSMIMSDFIRWWTGELFPTGLRATATGYNALISGILSAFSASISGFMALAFGLANGYAIIAIIGFMLVMAAVMAGRKLGYETKGVSLEF
ncbi:MAG: MFS transporter [Candidatus Bathyarchaeia archaeon]